MTTMAIDRDMPATGMAQGPGDDAALIYRFEGELRDAAPVSVCNEGIRFVNEIDAKVIAGPFSGARLTGLDQFTLRPDGAGFVTGPEAIEPGGAPVSLDVRGYVVPPQGVELPLPEVMASPGFDFPDLDFRVTGSALIRTADPRYAHLDRAVASLEGWVNFESGEMEVEARAM